VYSRWFDFYNHRLRCLLRRQGSLKLGLNSKKDFSGKMQQLPWAVPVRFVVPTQRPQWGCLPAPRMLVPGNWLQKAGSTENSSARRAIQGKSKLVRFRAHSPADNALYRTFTARRLDDRSHNQFQLLPIRLPCSSRCNIFLRSGVYKRRTGVRTSVSFRLPFDFSS
jgi:hypothetical protein